MKTHRPLKGLALALSCGALSSAAAAFQEDVAWQEESLKHKGLKDFELVLPDEASSWKKLGDSIRVHGVEFPVEVQGDLKFEIDTNGDEIVDEAVKGNAGYVELRGESEDGYKFRYAVRFRNTGAKRWDWSPSHVVSGKVNGQVVHFVDRNGNGQYDDVGKDAYFIGNDRGGALLSTVLNLDGELFEVEVAKSGETLKARPFVGETATLIAADVDGLKGKLVSAVFQSGSYSFNLAGEGKGLLVPAGKYKFESGFVERGSETAVMSAGDMEAIELAAGSTHEVEWGGPLVGYINEPKMKGSDKVEVSPTLHIRGKAGEAYGDFLPSGKVPEFFVYDKKTGKLLEKGRFPAG